MTNDVQIISFDGTMLAAEIIGQLHKGAVIMAPGGGQTRHAWTGAANALARAGYLVLSADLRGHGESDWSATNTYSYFDHAKDALALADWFEKKTDRKPHYIGASLGGVVGLIASGIMRPDAFASLTMVDVAARINEDGFSSIRSFMRESVRDGFATLEDAAGFISKHFPRPGSTSANPAGLRKNLKQGDDGRWRWHWDPAFVETLHLPPDDFEKMVNDAAISLTTPAHLVRGGASELVSKEAADHFLNLAPHIHYTEIEGARHMVTGDKNDIFIDAALKFIEKIDT